MSFYSTTGDAMQYRNSELRLDQIVTYLNEEKINLSPVFQRGHVWTLPVRQKLIRNILQGKPIPAIFLYKEASGTKYTYNILDGKQRLESIVLFIGNERADLQIPKWKRYFFAEKQRKDAGFEVDLGAGDDGTGGKKSFGELNDAAIRDLREYSIPTIEITLGDDSNLDDMISLFVDINQQGVKVNRFDIVKAMGRNDMLLMDVFDLIAVQQKRGEDIHYRTRRTPFTNILKTVAVIGKLVDQKSQVDRMWERLLELVLFQRTKKHRKPVDVLKSFISKPDHPSARLGDTEIKNLRQVFTFLGHAYRETTIAETRLATDQTHFYSMVTAIIGGDLLNSVGIEPLKAKLQRFANILEKIETLPDDHLSSAPIKKYLEVSAKQTTDASRRETRQQQFIEAIEGL